MIDVGKVYFVLILVKLDQEVRVGVRLAILLEARDDQVKLCLATCSVFFVEGAAHKEVWLASAVVFVDQGPRIAP